MTHSFLQQVSGLNEELKAKEAAQQKVLSYTHWEGGREGRLVCVHLVLFTAGAEHSCRVQAQRGCHCKGG